MFKNKIVRSIVITYGIIAATLFTIPALFFYTNIDFERLWLLYLGNVLFLICIIAAIITMNKKHGGNVTTKSLLVGGHAATLIGVIAATVVTFVLLLIFAPEAFQGAPTGEILKERPVNTSNILFIVFLDATLGNFIGGSFSSILLPYAVKRNQKTERGNEVTDI